MNTPKPPSPICRRCKIGPGPLCKKCVDRALLALGTPTPERRRDDRPAVPPRRRPDWRSL